MPPISRRAFLAGAAAVALTHGRGLPARAGEPAPSDWPSHGCGPAQTRHNFRETLLDPEAAGRLELAWRFEAGSGITGTPAVVGDRVVVGSWDGKVYALNWRSGAPLWSFDAGVRRYPPDRSLGIFASPAIDGGKVFVASDRLLALDLDSGRLLWEHTIGDPQTTFEYFWAPPLVHGGRLFAGVSAGSETETRGRIVCLDPNDGKVVWTFFTVAPEVSGGALIAPPSLDPRRGLLFAATGNPFHVRPGPLRHSVSLLALAADSGKLRWADQVHPHDTRNLDLNCPPMLLDLRGTREGIVVVGGKDGIRAWDRATRRRLWHVQLTPSRPPGGGDEALPTTGPEAGPTASDGELVFFASNNHADKTCALAAIEAASGEIRWIHSLPAFQFAPLSVAAGVVYIGLVDGRLRAFRAGDGAPLWESPSGQPIAGGPAIARGMVLVGTGAGEFLPGNQLLAFAPRSGSGA